jgi:D-tyrosyl-tRNA(Tyr) deacylase
MHQKLYQHSARNCASFPSNRNRILLVIALVTAFHRAPVAEAMRLVIQRVKSASVTVEQKQVSAIGPGMLALVGLHLEDKDSDLQYCAKKLLAIKLWENQNGAPWRQHVKQKEFEILCVSQFTLYGTLSKKNQPDYKLSMKADQAQRKYNQFLQILRDGYAKEKISDGKFGEMMDVELINDGPVTLVIDSRDEMLKKQMSSMTDGEKNSSEVES